MTNETKPFEKPAVSINVCQPTMRGPARTDPEQWWYIRFLRRFFDLRFHDRPDFLFYGDAGNGEHLSYPPSVIRIFTTGENILPNWQEADYALTHERVYSHRHWRLPLHRHWFDTTCTEPERDFSIISKRVSRFCNFIYSNDKAQERIEFFKLLSRYRPVDSGGAVCNNMNGRVNDKRALVCQSKFTIAFENSSRSGYSTEKIIEPLLYGSIPIYWGDPDISQDFNPACFINVHDFGNLDSVVDLVKQIDQDDSLWKSYVTAPIFPGGRMPAKLTDDAIVRFFGNIFAHGRAQNSRRVRMKQRIGYHWANSRIMESFDKAIASFHRRIGAVGRR
ncbi:glycosyltransferase family 10 domain-containing protein [Elongatibacter sediminis]|uniref:Glycosyltransferase family 10 n=1 Tax=Elongatibacter sediminis TaxID=3119006 RepID=A0AAW9RD87_9GAMM